MEIKLYTRKQLADFWKCSVYTIQDLQNTGLLKGRKFGRSWKYSEDDIKEFFDKTKGADIDNYTKMALYADKIKARQQQLTSELENIVH